MSMPGGILDAKVLSLLQVVEEKRDRECDRLIEAASRQAHEMVATAWREERQRLHREIVQVREQVRRRLVSAEAQRQTRQRQRRQAQDQALLASACDALRVALSQRWQEAAGRQQWSARLVEQAAEALLGKSWAIQHPVDWPSGEREAVARQVQQLCGEPPQFEPDDRLEAGLRICSPGACVDGSIDGLLHNGADVEAQLLAMCACEPGEAS